MSASRREAGLTAALCAVGSALALVASAQDWARATVSVGPDLPTVAVAAAGRELAPAAAGLALVGLAGAVALLVTRGVGRTLTGLVLLASGLGIAFASATTGADLDGAIRDVAGRAIGHTSAEPASVAGTVWPWLCLLAGLLVAVAGALTTARGRRWPGMSSRYDAPAVTRGSGGQWEALDRGEDPTT